MGRRSDIDWEKVERLYVAGQLTIRQIAEECGIAPYSVTTKAKEKGWKKNVAEEIKQRTKEKIAQIDVAELIEQSAHESAQKSAQTLKQAIEEAANNAASVRLRQRADIKQETERSESLQQILETQLSTLESIGDILRATQAYKNLLDIKLKLQEREDKVFGLNDDADSDGGEETVIIVNGVKVDG